MDWLRRALRAILEFLVGRIEAVAADPRLSQETIDQIAEALRNLLAQQQLEAAALQAPVPALPAEEDELGEVYPVHDPREPLVYRYFDGVRERAIDPMAAWIALERHPDWNQSLVFVQIQAGDLAGYEAALRVSRKFFGLVPWSEETGQGMTDQAALDVMFGFWTLRDRVKKNIDAPLNLPRSAAVEFYLAEQTREARETQEKCQAIERGTARPNGDSASTPNTSDGSSV